MTQRSARLEYAIWLVSIAATRLPVAMTPLAMVFLGSQLLDSYAHGLVLAGLFAVAEACCAPLLGVRLSLASFRREATVGLLLSAGAYSTVAILGGAVQPAAWLIAVLAGGGAAAVPGVLRTGVGNIVHGDQMNRSFRLEVGVTMACWAVAPALVAALSFSLSPRAVFAVCGLLLLAGAVSVRVMPEATAVQKPVREAPGTTRWASLSVLWPIFINAGLAEHRVLRGAAAAGHARRQRREPSACRCSAFSDGHRQHRRGAVVRLAEDPRRTCRAQLVGPDSDDGRCRSSGPERVDTSISRPAVRRRSRSVGVYRRAQSDAASAAETRSARRGLLSAVLTQRPRVRVERCGSRSSCQESSSPISTCHRGGDRRNRRRRSRRHCAAQLEGPNRMSSHYNRSERPGVASASACARGFCIARADSEIRINPPSPVTASIPGSRGHICLQAKTSR